MVARRSRRAARPNPKTSWCANGSGSRQMARAITGCCDPQTFRQHALGREAIGRIGNIHPRDVGYAGLKDRNAVAEQAFTCRCARRWAEWVGVSGEGFEVLSAQRHRRKLKRGALRGNDFEIVLRDFEGDTAGSSGACAQLPTRGVPNYFGPQRFGRDGWQPRDRSAMVRAAHAPLDRVQRGFAISAARSAIFNAVAAARVPDGTWNRALRGRCRESRRQRQHFRGRRDVDEPWWNGADVLDIHPTGPLWHGESPTGAIAATGAGSRRSARDARSRSGAAGLEPERRALRLRVRRL